MQSRLRFWTFSILVLALGVVDNARAQGIEGVRPARAEVEIFGGYSYMRSTTAVSGAPINLNGASSAMGFYVKSWLGLVGDLGVYHQGDIAASGLSLTVSSYQFGPRVRLRNHTHMTPFGQLLLGVGHAGGTLYTRSLGPGLSPLGTNNGFLFTGGGGVDWKLTPRIGIRLLQVEYLRSQFLNGSGNGNRQENLRLSTGIVFSFGND
ncbi:MAG: hypothetical protein ABSA57_12300 [Candidatus Acidiferrales bacterium]